jgi:hypothetical protein
MIAVYMLKLYVKMRGSWNQTIWMAKTKATLQYLLFQKALRTKQFSSDTKKASPNDKDPTKKQ